LLATSFDEVEAAAEPDLTDFSTHRDAETGLNFWFRRAER